MKQNALSMILVAMVLAPAVAHAGAEEDVAAGVDTAAMWMPSLRESPAGRMHGSHEPATGCQKAVAAGRKAGLGDTAKIYSDRFSGWDEAHSDDQRRTYLQLGEVSAMCDEYAQLLLMIPAAFAQAETAQSLRTYSTIDPSSLGADMGEAMTKSGRTCMAETDKAIKAGAPADRKTKIGDQQLTLTEGKTQICQAMIDFGGKLGGDIKQAHGAERDKIAAKYIKVGVKGAKLDLFVEYDDVYWRGKGCEIISDVKTLAKAKKLYHWLENADGTHTIRTYTFSGNKVKSVKNKTFRTEAQAYKGCK